VAGAQLELRKIGVQRVQIKAQDGEWSGLIGQVPVTMRCDRARLPELGSFALAARGCGIAGDVGLEDPLEGGAAALAQDVSRAAAVIRATDPEMYERLRLRTRWFVPLEVMGPSTHRSLTVRSMPSCMFLSRNTTVERLSEAIVHELSHAELNVMMDSKPLFSDAFRNERFYSPWRPDPRPLFGVLHAIYVFTQVAEFQKLLRERQASTPGENSDVGRRLADGLARLRTARRQVPPHALTAAGRALMDECSARATAVEQSVVALPPMWGPVSEHFDAWAKANPVEARAATDPRLLA
jgi:hypothetical protein